MYIIKVPSNKSKTKYHEASNGEKSLDFQHTSAIEGHKYSVAATGSFSCGLNFVYYLH